MLSMNVNPLTPKSDKRLISPFNITPESHIKVMRIKEMITNLRGLDCYSNTPCSTLGNVEKIVWRICILMLGCKGLKETFTQHFSLTVV